MSLSRAALLFCLIPSLHAEPSRSQSPPPRVQRVQLVPRGGGAALGFGTIQEAVDAASPGDTVLLAPGVYTGAGNKNVSVAKQITILGQAGAASTVVDCEGSGRGFRFQPGSDALTTLQGVTVRNGNATNGGAVLQDPGASPNLVDCAFELCSATQGGALYASQGTLRARGLQVSDNTASLGGGLCLVTMTGSASGCHVAGNRATTLGGGMGVFGPLQQDPITGLRIEDTLLADNTAPSSAGIYIEFVDAFTMDRCRVVQNHADNVAGGIGYTGDFFLLASDYAFFQNSVIAQNTAADTAGMNVSLAAVVVQNCTIADNVSSSGGTGGLSAVATDGILVLNTILWGNQGVGTTTLDQQIELGTTALTLVFNDDIQGLGPDPANFSADPLFANPAGLNYRLGNRSPCINAGLFFSLASVQTDVDGLPRVLGAEIDVGAHEKVVDTVLALSPGPGGPR